VPYSPTAAVRLKSAPARWTTLRFLSNVPSLGKDHAMDVSKNLDVATRFGTAIGIALSAVIYGLAIGPLIYHYMR
jgi:hypothetical protein